MTFFSTVICLALKAYTCYRLILLLQLYFVNHEFFSLELFFQSNCREMNTVRLALSIIRQRKKIRFW